MGRKPKQAPVPAKKIRNQDERTIFALDIGTRSIIGMVGVQENDKIKITAIEKEEHAERAMIDGQIEDIEKVAALGQKVKKRLESKTHTRLSRVCVAAAGRALKTKRADFELNLPGPQVIDDEIISRLEAGAISKAEEAFDAETESAEDLRRFYLAGYTVCQYYLDGYMISNLKDHHGKKVKVDLIATFLPSEVVDSLYTTMHKIGLEVASITLEPIAAINAAIPVNLRLLNLVMVDIGAGTSDIAVCTDGSVTGYTMATVAGDEITETLMKEYLVDFPTAESMKVQAEAEEEIHFTDILGLEQTTTRQDLLLCIHGTSDFLCKEIAEKVLEINGAPPSALFLAGGGSKLAGLKEGLTAALQMDAKRVAIAGNNFHINAFSKDYDLNSPEYATPLGIVVSSGLNLINDSFRVNLNGKPAKLFRSGSFTALNLLMMNGYNFHDIVGRRGANLIVTVNGKRKIFYGTTAQPASLYINKKEGKLSEIIHAGDQIEFIPAVQGKPARAHLGDIEGTLDCTELTLNGSPADPDTPLKSHDIIMFIPRRPLQNTPDEPFMVTEAADDDAFTGNAGAEEDTVPEKTEEKRTMAENAVPKDMAADKAPAKSAAAEDITTADKVLTKSAPAEDITANKAFTKNTAAKEEITNIPAKVSAIESAVPQKAAPQNKASAEIAPPVIFHLNGAPLSLQPKEDEKPYYLMDLIQYSGIDLKQPRGKIILTVNGNPGMFQQPLKPGDIVQIEEETS